ncbi:hypothetical protein P154DRAFT_580687 [Amniculicola lignicola CBS 123094]|uniref:Uncharacterized protein n=1 Tax=Amniculicola lignicola CBS 123094 TaxID=1392246 RepID=A0A6A5WDB0_9PLEO|nr:hypothetical protein P154DRAFT_580687 [Amniculicola lignicola CBS 123094]
MAPGEHKQPISISYRCPVARRAARRARSVRLWTLTGASLASVRPSGTDTTARIGHAAWSNFSLQRSHLVLKPSDRRLPGRIVCTATANLSSSSSFRRRCTRSGSWFRLAFLVCSALDAARAAVVQPRTQAFAVVAGLAT